MNNDENINSAQELLNNLFKNSNTEKMQESLGIVNKWREILSSIKENNFDKNSYSAGMKMADHSRIVDLKNGVLLVETDHPGWNQKIIFHQNYILTGLKRAFPNLDIKSIVFRLKGDKNILKNIEPKNKVEKVVEKINEIDEKEALKEIEKKMEEMPEDLSKMLNKLKESILTKD